MKNIAFIEHLFRNVYINDNYISTYLTLDIIFKQNLSQKYIIRIKMINKK